MFTVQGSKALHKGAGALVERCVSMAKLMLGGALEGLPYARGGRKAHPLDGSGAEVSAE